MISIFEFPQSSFVNPRLLLLLSLLRDSIIRGFQLHLTYCDVVAYHLSLFAKLFASQNGRHHGYRYFHRNFGQIFVNVVLLIAISHFSNVKLKIRVHRDLNYFLILSFIAVLPGKNLLNDLKFVISFGISVLDRYLFLEATENEIQVFSLSL